MKKLLALLLALGLGAAAATGCAYGGVAVTPNNQAVVLRNDLFLFGALRKAFVCQVTPAGLSACGTAENP